MKIIIESTDIDSFKDVITTFYHAFNTPSMKDQILALKPAELEAAPEVEPEEKEPKKSRRKPGRKPKSKAEEITLDEEPQEEVIDDPEADADDAKKPQASAMELDPPEEPKESKKSASAITKEAIFAALKKVSSTKGMIEARALLERYSCSRISELKEEQYKSFIDACERLAR